MNRAVDHLELPASIRSAAARLAEEDGIGLNDWITIAIAQKIAVVDSAEEFFKRRAERASGKGLKHYLDMAPDRAPDPGDELPDEWSPAQLNGRQAAG